MTAAGFERARDDARLLVVEGRSGRLHDRAVADLPELLAPGDLLVLNDAATLPASLRGQAAGGDPIELRLAGPPSGDRWPAVLFGAGDWRTRTEDRAAPPRVAPGERLRFDDLTAEVVSVALLSPRLVEVRFDRDGEALWRALYAVGRPVQYAYHDHDLALWTVQTAYAGRPWAVEMPSAGRPLGWRVLGGLRRRGVELAWLTHAAGLSSTGDPVLDAALPLPEQYDLPERTVQAVSRARAEGRRVLAVGTTVVRALEGAARQSGGLRSGAGTTSLVMSERTRPLVVDGLITGIHAPGESHFRLLGAFAPAAALAAAAAHADARGYRPHELGDLALLLPSLAVDTGLRPATLHRRRVAAAEI
jgi:S-adenosylmethionine:tRNA ribosyltransferase-isomerase